MPKCKHCGKMLGSLDKRKSWKLKGSIKDPATGKPFTFRIDLYDCSTCGKVTRTSTRIEE